VSDTGPIEVVYDNSPPNGQPGVLVEFAEGNQGRSLFALSEPQRRERVLTNLSAYFGAPAKQPTQYVDMIWAHDQYAGGAYGSFNPPGVITSLGEAVSGPVGNIQFAGADYSAEWPGYMEGAIRSGSAAARTVLASLVVTDSSDLEPARGLPDQIDDLLVIGRCHSSGFGSRSGLWPGPPKAMTRESR